jgi:arabinose-5-phosphate isomerase
MQELTESAKKTFEIEAQAIQNLSNQLTDDFSKAVSLLESTRGRVVVCGIGKSGLIGKKIAATFASIGTPAIFMHPVEAIHGDIGMLTENDIIMAISCSGETEEIIRLIPMVRQRGLTMIALAGNPDSTLAKESNLFLNVSVEREACPLQLVPTSSATAALVMGDALSIALMRQKDFTPTDFALRHPGGSLGKKLLTQVKDKMCSENLPIVEANTGFKDVITAISKGMKGIAVVIRKDRIVGTITDGDICRSISAHNGHSLEKNAFQMMTANPIVISEDALLVDAEKMMLDNKIVSLLVVAKEDNRKLVGIIQYYGIEHLS